MPSQGHGDIIRPDLVDELIEFLAPTVHEILARLDGDELKEAVIQGMQEDEGAGGRWLIERALDTRESTKLRKSALFWAGRTSKVCLTGLRRRAIFSSWA